MVSVICGLILLGVGVFHFIKWTKSETQLDRLEHSVDMWANIILANLVFLMGGF